MFPAFLRSIPAAVFPSPGAVNPLTACWSIWAAVLVDSHGYESPNSTEVAPAILASSIAQLSNVEIKFFLASALS